ncbi:MAG TPA: hypothetical protein VG405_02640 [Solirubrobacteraceae bacterium]|nr:hypothetical protein [Solirubrobacteraceae bacterium]
MSAHLNVEALLREALIPVEPPEALTERLETTLATLTASAQEELEAWELSTMSDPRNWVRPAAAAVVTATAGSALVALRVRRRHQARMDSSRTVWELAERTLQDIAQEARRVFPER